MDNSYLLDRETLGKFVDELLAQKYPNRPAGELASLREENIKKLDEEIGYAIFGALDEDQLAKFNQLLDGEENNPDVFRNFFKEAGIDIETIISDTIKEYTTDFLEEGGQNA